MELSQLFSDSSPDPEKKKKGLPIKGEEPLFQSVPDDPTAPQAEWARNHDNQEPEQRTGHQPRLGQMSLALK